MMIFIKKYLLLYLILTGSWSSLGIPWFCNTKTAQLFGYLQSVQQRIPAVKTTKDKKYAHFLHRKYLVLMPLIYFQERKIANRYKTDLLNSSE